MRCLKGQTLIQNKPSISEGSRGKNQYPLKSMILALSRENILTDNFICEITLENLQEPITPPERGWYFFLCCGEALRCKCLCQFYVLFAAECAAPVNDVAADGESVCGSFLVLPAWLSSALWRLPFLRGLLLPSAPGIFPEVHRMRNGFQK
mgnify:CR=1 FL=1